MSKQYLALGIDLGTSGIRLAIINQDQEQIYNGQQNYPIGLEEWKDWHMGCIELINAIPIEIKKNIKVCSAAGTSGTLLSCNLEGKPLDKALPYNFNCPSQADKLNKLLPEGGNAATINSSLARALFFLDKYREKIILRHQSDWIMGWLTGNWLYGEESNNLKLGWDPLNKTWPKSFFKQTWFSSLPKIVKSGTIIGQINPIHSISLNLPADLLIVAGTTDSNAAIIATNPKQTDGVTILGSTIVIKQLVEKPIDYIGITNHFIRGNWLCGGSSNAGGKTLNRFFHASELRELSRQINPENDSGLDLLPIASVGERFPIFDPYLKPVLEPRPISDSLYLHGLLEGLATIEARGWKKLKELGIPPPNQLITIGGGSINPQWRRLRERKIGIPIKTSKQTPAYGVALLALETFLQTLTNSKVVILLKNQYKRQ